MMLVRLAVSMYSWSRLVELQVPEKSSALIPFSLSVMAHELETEEQFQEWLEKAGDKLVVVDFWATWCGPCRVIGPVFDELSENKDLQNSVIFLKVDVDLLSDLAEDAGVECMPTFMFFKGGKKVASMAGANTSLLREYVEKYK